MGAVEGAQISSALRRLKGQHDDGTSDGIQRVKIDQGALHPLNIRDRGVASIAVGSATVGTVNTSIDTAQTGRPGGYQMVTPSGTSLQLGRMAVRVFGRRIALFLAANASPSPGELDVFINRRLVFSGSVMNRHLGIGVTTNEGHFALPLVDDLPDDGPHLVELVTWPDASVSSTINVYDILGEQRFYGAFRPRRVMESQTKITFTTGNGTVAQALPVGGHKNLRVIRVTSFDTGGPIDMIVDDGTTAVCVLTVPQAGSASKPGYVEWDMGEPVAISGWRIKCATNPTTGTVDVRTNTGN